MLLSFVFRRVSFLVFLTRVYRSHQRTNHGRESCEAGLQVSLPSHGCAGGAAVAHLGVLCAPGPRPRIGLPVGGMARRGAPGVPQRHVGDAHRLEEDRGVRVPGRGVVGAVAAGTASPPAGIRELLRQACAVSAVRIAQAVAGVGGVHRQRLPLPRRAVVPGRDGRALGHRVVAAAARGSGALDGDREQGCGGKVVRVPAVRGHRRVRSRTPPRGGGGRGTDLPGAPVHRGEDRRPPPRAPRPEAVGQGTAGARP